MVKELMYSAPHALELSAIFRITFDRNAPKPSEESIDQLANRLPDKAFCYEVLTKVSRSFAVVIQQLPEELKDPVCIFYLTLRALDSIEDDMSLDETYKNNLLRNFYKQCGDGSLTYPGIGDTEDYRMLMKNYDKVARVYSSLDSSYIEVIEDITRRMGHGMADYADLKVNTVSEYDHYCHYVAGLVGYGLSGLFSASGLEDENLRYQYRLSNSMGLFLQKTNIIRDYREDLDMGRRFWPSEVWEKYADSFSWFSENPEHEKSLTCLNVLVADALRHLPDAITYLKLLRNTQVFRFCAIPQVMAAATLAKVFNNPDVFEKNVKIRKGMAAKIMVYTDNVDFALNEIQRHLESIRAMARPGEEYYHEVIKQVNKALEVLHAPVNSREIYDRSLVNKAS
ncbi:MAG: squalene synthase [Flavobacteriales bacterium]|nr:squalene synthase [Flavobacteriales bacterium]